MSSKSKRKSTKKKPAKKMVRDFPRLLVRVPPDLAKWLDETAAELGYSRDAFIRTMLIGYRDGMKLASRPDGASLFADIRQQAGEIAREAMEKAVRDVIARADVRGGN